MLIDTTDKSILLLAEMLELLTKSINERLAIVAKSNSAMANNFQVLESKVSRLENRK